MLKTERLRFHMRVHLGLRGWLYGQLTEHRGGIN